MKYTEREQAKDLFFQSNLSKTEIAQRLNVSRRTVLLWSQQGNWDKLRMSARHMPSMVAEKCYYLLDQYTSYLLGDGNVMATFQLKHAQAIHLLASTIKKLKNRSTVNESMEMFSFFLDGLRRKEPELAAELVPHVENYISGRESVTVNDFLLDGFNQDGSLPYPEKEIREKWQDEKDGESLMEEFRLFLKTREANAPPAAPPSAQQDPAKQKEEEPAQPQPSAAMQGPGTSPNEEPAAEPSGQSSQPPAQSATQPPASQQGALDSNIDDWLADEERREAEVQKRRAEIWAKANELINKANNGSGNPGSSGNNSI